MNGFKVQSKQCATCIYFPKSGFDIKALEEQVRDPYMGFKSYRACHHATDKAQVCCRGFWDRHKDEFATGQIAQRLGAVEFIHVDKFASEDANLLGHHARSDIAAQGASNEKRKKPHRVSR